MHFLALLSFESPVCRELTQWTNVCLKLTQWTKIEAPADRCSTGARGFRMASAPDARLAHLDLVPFDVRLCVALGLPAGFPSGNPFPLPAFNGDDCIGLSTACSHCFELWPCIRCVAPFAFNDLCASVQQVFHSYLNHTFQGVQLSVRTKQPPPELQFDVFHTLLMSCVEGYLASGKLHFVVVNAPTFAEFQMLGGFSEYVSHKQFLSPDLAASDSFFDFPDAFDGLEPLRLCCPHLYPQLHRLGLPICSVSTCCLSARPGETCGVASCPLVIDDPDLLTPSNRLRFSPTYCRVPSDMDILLRNATPFDFRKMSFPHHLESSCGRCAIQHFLFPSLSGDLLAFRLPSSCLVGICSPTWLPSVHSALMHLSHSHLRSHEVCLLYCPQYLDAIQPPSGELLIHSVLSHLSRA